MSMGKVAMEGGEYSGCILKEKEDLDKLVTAMQDCDGVIIGCPTYDLMPSSVYTRFAQRFLAYEQAFFLKIGALKEDKHCVAGLIAVGGSCHDWQGLSLETMAATMFTQSIKVVDQYMVTRVGRPENIVLREDHLERCHKMGENIIKAIQTPVEEREWLGDPDLGLCPNCHGGLIFKGDVHWDGVQFPFECAVCGAGGDLVKGEDGKTRFVLAENGLCRDRNVDKCRDLHLDEIIETRIHFFQNMGEAQAKMAKYRELKFPTV